MSHYINHELGVCADRHWHVPACQWCFWCFMTLNIVWAEPLLPYKAITFPPVELSPSLSLSRCLHMALWPAKGASIYDVCTRGGRGSWKSRRGNGAQEGRLRENVDKVEGVTNFANIIDERPLRSALSLWRQLWSNNSLAPFPSFAFRFIHRTEKNVSLPFWMSLAGAAGYVSVPKPRGKNSTWEVDMLFTSLYNSLFIIHNSPSDVHKSEFRTRIHKFTSLSYKALLCWVLTILDRL